MLVRSHWPVVSAEVFSSDHSFGSGKARMWTWDDGTRPNEYKSQLTKMQCEHVHCKNVKVVEHGDILNFTNLFNLRLFFFLMTPHFGNQYANIK